MFLIVLSICLIEILSIIVLNSNEQYIIDYIYPIDVSHKPFLEGIDVINKNNKKKSFDSCYKNNKFISSCIGSILNDHYYFIYSSGLINNSYILINNSTKEHNNKSYVISKKNEPIFLEGLSVVDDKELKDVQIMVAHEYKKKIEVIHFNLLNETINSINYLNIKIDSNELWGLTIDKNSKKLYLTSENSNLYYADISNIDLHPSSTIFFKFFFDLGKCKKFTNINPNSIAYDKYDNSIWVNDWLNDKIFKFNLDTKQCTNYINLQENAYFAKYKRSKYVSNEVCWNGITVLQKNWLVIGGKLFDKSFLIKVK